MQLGSCPAIEGLEDEYPFRVMPFCPFPHTLRRLIRLLRQLRTSEDVVRTQSAVAFRRSFAVALVVCLAAMVGADVRAASAADCPPPPSAVQPFLNWADTNSYVLTTGGSFEPGSALWSLSGGANLTAGNAPNPIDSSSDSYSLSLPSGSSVTSACVTAPKIVGIVRFFARSSGTVGTQLKVEVLVKGRVYQAGTVTPGSSWTPSPMLSSDAPAYKGAVTYQVRLTATGSGGAVNVDDVYFDPYVSR
jgi:hypothetical protein